MNKSTHTPHLSVSKTFVEPTAHTSSAHFPHVIITFELAKIWRHHLSTCVPEALGFLTITVRFFRQGCEWHCGWHGSRKLVHQRVDTGALHPSSSATYVPPGGIMGSLPLILHHPWCYVEGVESTLLRQSLICFVLDNTWHYISICDISAICSLSVTLDSTLPLSFLYVYTPVLFFWMLFVPGDDLISPQRCVLQACSHP